LRVPLLVLFPVINKSTTSALLLFPAMSHGRTLNFESLFCSVGPSILKVVLLSRNFNFEGLSQRGVEGLLLQIPSLVAQRPPQPHAARESLRNSAQGRWLTSVALSWLRLLRPFSLKAASCQHAPDFCELPRRASDLQVGRMLGVVAPAPCLQVASVVLCNMAAVAAQTAQQTQSWHLCCAGARAGKGTIIAQAICCFHGRAASWCCLAAPFLRHVRGVMRRAPHMLGHVRDVAVRPGAVLIDLLMRTRRGCPESRTTGARCDEHARSAQRWLDHFVLPSVPVAVPIDG